ncbi:MAG: cold shock domain-containing protein [Flavobacteriaceae bacterium]|jgi:cold shock CspA family protein|nr:cold shock domain-containing protein [Flavobacteriaceae bacterium]
MADSFSKKENLKKKAQKRQEKAQKREERKTNNNKGKSLEDMLVYVDRFGNLTDLSPEQQAEEEAKQAKYPKKEVIHSTDENTIFTGIVNYYSEKGFGFITEDQTKESIFVHGSETNQPLQKGAKVQYQKKQTAKGINAVAVKII